LANLGSVRIFAKLLLGAVLIFNLISMSVSINVDISVEDFYDELYDSDKKELAEMLKEDGFLDDEDEEVLDKFQNLQRQYFRFTKEDEEILENLFNKYNI